MRWPERRLRDAGWVELQDGRFVRQDVGPKRPARSRASIRKQGSTQGAPAIPAARPVFPDRQEAPPPLPAARVARLHPEQLLQARAIALYRPLLLPDAYLVPLNGELGNVATRGRGRDVEEQVARLRNAQAVRRSMGYEAGTPDLLALRALPQPFHGFVELKRDTGDPDLLGHRKAKGWLTPEQRAWRDRCRRHQHPWVLARTLLELGEVLDRWRMLIPGWRGLAQARGS